jgi:hypothetical protein
VLAARRVPGDDHRDLEVPLFASGDPLRLVRHARVGGAIAHERRKPLADGVEVHGPAPAGGGVGGQVHAMAAVIGPCANGANRLYPVGCVVTTLRRRTY